MKETECGITGSKLQGKTKMTVEKLFLTPKWPPLFPHDFMIRDEYFLPSLI
jgi:hypothetical protein